MSTAGVPLVHHEAHGSSRASWTRDEAVVLVDRDAGPAGGHPGRADGPTRRRAPVRVANYQLTLGRRYGGSCSVTRLRLRDHIGTSSMARKTASTNMGDSLRSLLVPDELSQAVAAARLEFACNGVRAVTSWQPAQPHQFVSSPKKQTQGFIDTSLLTLPQALLIVAGIRSL